jgi:DNA polymerase-3 subunit delta
MMAMHIARLQQLRIEIDAGKSPEEAVRAARPPIFFKKAGGVVRQLRLWDIDALVAAGASVAQATRASRSGSELDEAITGRTLLALARTARQTRLGRY